VLSYCSGVEIEVSPYRDLTGLEHINILLDLSSTRDFRILLCMIGMIEKMLGFWDTNSFCPLLIWRVLGL